MEKLDRRKFLKLGVVGAGGMLVLSNDNIGGLPLTQKNIIYRTLGKTGLKVPVIGMGVMTADNPNLVRAALDKGITFFDTAHMYQNGRNEEMLGDVFKDYPRDSFLICTKVVPGGVDINTGLPSRATKPKDFLEKFNTSLQRLGLEYVDILYMHKALTSEMVNFKPIVNAMQKLKQEGKARFIGVSTHNLPAIIDAMVDAGTWDVVETTYNYLNTELIRANSESPVFGMDAAIKKAGDAGIGVVAMKALAGGGFLDKERTKPINATAAIKWVLLNPDVHTVIPGMTTFEQLELDSKILEDIALNDQEKKDIALTQTEAGMYCTACNNCVPECKLNLPIPEIMRAYMYTYGYKNQEMAYDLLTDISAGDNPCKTCSTCSAICSKNFDLKQKITDVSRLLNVPSDFIT